ncbi:hypothetical protein GCM10011504_14960 [Siccirubricoccus deserti]|uniref:DUF3306 domain-containing protein n=1 Tax=Siccirubricoccus deserti TaxID=2013562 RepID=A0A9X0QWI9_9PROT|nr:DUF3306 domain-containing protein [Siccirubricoccus deserti]MBC4015271.1 DUF3306 domain-containing protein [Siccirubricoccus deserti]GGC37590.1 hypothetical protein GCM10011504_14960 [Siccirubricoccus deserti]
MSGQEGFLARWSRRKRAAAEPSAPEPLPVPASVEAVPEPPAVPEFDPASLPAVESLTLESDFTAFLRAEVPAALRQAALRRMWSLDPDIRDYVGPADYAWDFNAPDGMPGFALELGGDVKRLLAQAIGLGEQPEAADAEAVPDAPPPVAEPSPLLAQAAPPAPPLPPVPEMPAAPVPSPRRSHGSARPS